jgi:hypothetical protein
MSRDSSRNSSRRPSSTTSTTPHVWVPRHVARLVTWLVALLVVDYSTSHRLVVDYFASAARPGAFARHAARRTARRRLLRLAQARRRLVCFRRASGCLGTSRGSSRGSSRRSSPTTPRRLGSSSTTLPRAGLSSTTTRRAGSSSTTSPPSCVRMPQHIAGLVTQLVVPLVVDYSASRRLVLDYFASAARPGASARRAARLAARRAVRRRLLRLAQARRRLLRLRHASGCLGTSRGSSCGSSRRSSSITPPHAGSLSTISPTPRVRVPWHVARPVTRLIVDYSVPRDFVLRPRWLYFSHAVRRDYLSRGNTGSTSSAPRAAMTSSSGRIASTIYLD